LTREKRDGALLYPYECSVPKREEGRGGKKAHSGFRSKKKDLSTGLPPGRKGKGRGSVFHYRGEGKGTPFFLKKDTPLGQKKKRGELGDYSFKRKEGGKASTQQRRRKK